MPKIVRVREDRRKSNPPRKIVEFDATHANSAEPAHNDIQLMRARIMSTGQQSRVLKGMSPGPMGENRPSNPNEGGGE